MADTMLVVITLRKEVPDRDSARTIFDLVKQKMSDRPDIVVTGHCSNHFDLNSE